jgi:4-hydroxybenzoate polyprenyltransferase
MPFAADIKIEHSIFALPFAATALSMLEFARISASQLIFLLFCMVGARSFAMGMNRFLDRDIDLKNPRTQARQIPSGQLSPTHGLLWSVAFGVLFVACAFGLNSLAGILSIPVLAILAGYSFMKRISWLTHWYLGACLGLAPIAVSIALTGWVRPEILALGIAVTFWTAGFDILYATQDVLFDVSHNFHSIPARIGVQRAVLISRGCFTVMVLCLIGAGVIYGKAGPLYYVGVGLVGSILAYEHWLVRDLRVTGQSAKLNAAFFTSNAWVSVIFYALAQLDKLL